jgi:hypothetical protein
MSPAQARGRIMQDSPAQTRGPLTSPVTFFTIFFFLKKKKKKKANKTLFITPPGCLGGGIWAGYQSHFIRIANDTSQAGWQQTHKKGVTSNAWIDHIMKLKE